MVSVTSELTVSIMILVTSEHRGVVLLQQLKPAYVTSCGSGPNVVTVGWLPDRVSLCFMSVPHF